MLAAAIISIPSSSSAWYTNVDIEKALGRCLQLHRIAMDLQSMQSLSLSIQLLQHHLNSHGELMFQELQ